MPFPTSPVPIVVEIAPGANPAADPSTWAWTDITQYTTARDGGVKTSVGKADEFGTAGSSTCTVTVNNVGGRFVPRNPTGPYYPNLRRNTPLRVRVQAATDTFTRSVSSGWGAATSGQAWTTTGGVAADYNATGSAGTMRLGSTVTVRTAALAGLPLLDFDIKVSVTLSATPTGAPIDVELRAREVDATNFVDARLFVFTSGVVQANVRQMVAGVETFSAFPVVPAVTATTPLTMRFVAAGSTLRVKVWATASSEPTTWNATMTTAMLTPGAIVLRGLRETSNTNTNPTLTWDNLTVCVDRMTGFIDSFPATWDDLVPFVQLSASGPSRRLGQSDTELVSAMRRAIAAAGPVAYWPMEGAGGLRYPEIQERAPIFASGLSGGSDSPGGSAALPSFSSDAAARGTVARYTPAPRWSVEFLLKPNEPAAEATYLTWYTTATVAPYWSFGITPGGTDNFFLRAVTSTSTIAAITIPFNLGTPYTEWLYVRVVAEEDGGGNLVVDWRVWAFATERNLIFSATNTTTIFSPAGLVNQVFVGPVADGATIGHVSVWRTDTRDLATDNARYVDGFTGETAGARLLRIAAENGVPLRVDGDPADTTVMGPQPVASFLTVAKECEATDGGILYDGLDGRSTYLTRAARHNALVLLPLDNADGDLTPDFAPVDDDQGLRNAVTASRQGGSSATYEDAASIAAEGRYEASVSVNVRDDTSLLDQAAWRVHLGTVDDMRYPTISLNLLGNTDLIPAWLSCSPGARATIANQPSELPPGLIDQHTLGWSEEMDGADWTTRLNCVPARPFNIAVLEGTNPATQARVGSDASTLNSGITTTGTSLSVAISDGNLWTTSAGDRPFDIGIAGERMTVTNITGASSPQTFTVTRSVNGVVKTHSSGEQVRLWQPAVVGL